jgi:hypothetical protein
MNHPPSILDMLDKAGRRYDGFLEWLKDQAAIILSN